MKSKIFLLILIFIIASSPISFAFSDNYIWSVLDDSIVTSAPVGQR